MMYFYEDKNYIIQMLLQALRFTIAGQGIAEIEYKMISNGDEFATIIYDNGCRKPINITADSGVALMRDILRGLE